MTDMTDTSGLKVFPEIDIIENMNTLVLGTHVRVQRAGKWWLVPVMEKHIDVTSMTNDDKLTIWKRFLGGIAQVQVLWILDIGNRGGITTCILDSNQEDEYLRMLKKAMLGNGTQIQDV